MTNLGTTSKLAAKPESTPATTTSSLRWPTRLGRAALGAVTMLGVAGIGTFTGVGHAAAATTFNVTSTADAGLTSGSSTTCSATLGMCTLRAAVEAANNLGGAVTINLEAGTYILSLGAITVGTAANESISIIGTGSSSTAIEQMQGSSCTASGTNCNQIFVVDPNGVGDVSFSLSDSSVSGGATSGSTTPFDNGGAISAGGTGDSTTLSNDTFSGNDVEGTAQNAPGGAVSQQGGNLSVTNCAFNSNSAGDSSGGAIDFEAADGAADTLTVTGSTFSGNTSADPAGGGGAIFLDNLIEPGTVTASVTGSTFTSNSSTKGTSSATGGGAILVESGTLNAYSDNFVSNTAAGSATGGAVGVDSGHSTLAGDRFASDSDTADSGTDVAADSANGGSVTANDNWWGSDTVSASDVTAGVTDSSFLELRVSVSVNPVITGSTTTVRADLTHDNSDNSYTTTPLPDGILVSFGGTAGTYGSGSSESTVSGAASDVMTTGAPGSYTAGASVTVDSQTVTTSVTVNGSAPAITSAGSTTFDAGSAGTFTVTTSGDPTPSLTYSGSLPSGVGFVDNGDGTATLSGTPAAGTGGSYPLEITASGFGTPAVQDFTLTVDESPGITSAGSATFTIGTPGTFQVTASGYPTSSIVESGTLPSGVNFSNGEFSGTPAAGTIGTYPITLTATSTFGTPAVQSFTLTVDGEVPTITWPTPNAITYGQHLSKTQLDATSPVPGTFAYFPPAGTVPNAGSQTLSVQFTPTDLNTYAPESASVQLTVNQANPKVTWPSAAPISYGMPLSGIELDAFASVPGNFDYSEPPGTILPVGNNPLSVTFTPDDSTDYKTVTLHETLVVTRGSMTINTPNDVSPQPFVPNGPDAGSFTAGAIASSPDVTPNGVLSFYATNTITSVSSFLCSGNFNNVGVASCASTKHLAVGEYAVVAKFAGNKNFETAISTPGDLDVQGIATSLSTSGVTAPQPGIHRIVFSYALRQEVSGEPVPYELVTVNFNGQHCSAKTNVDGLGHCGITTNTANDVGQPGYGVVFNGDQDYGSSSTTGAVTWVPLSHIVLGAEEHGISING